MGGVITQFIVAIVMNILYQTSVPGVKRGSVLTNGRLDVILIMPRPYKWVWLIEVWFAVGMANLVVEQVCSRRDIAGGRGTPSPVCPPDGTTRPLSERGTGQGTHP